MTENLSTEPLAGASHVAASDGGVTVESPALTLAELNAQLGSTFTDVPTALRALKDTNAYVGKRKEDIAAEVKASLIPATPQDTATKADVQRLSNELFYSQNPQYKPYESLISKLGANPADVVNLPEVKEVIGKASVADEVVNNRSVVNSNARLSQSKTVLDEAVSIANARGTTNEDVAVVFARSINQANNGQ